MERSFPNTSNSNLSEMLSQEIEDLNKDTAEDRSVKEAIIVDKPDPNKINTEESEDDSDDGRYYVDDDIDSDEYEHDLAIRDPVLFRITESNRHIAVKDLTAEDSHTKSKGSRRPPELVFSEPPILISRDDCIEVSFYYGLSNEKKTGRCQRYMVMCGIGEESMNALRWGLGTILRSGDEIHISSVVPNDEPVESMDSDEKYNLWRQLDRNSKTMISRVRSIMDEMLLYNIKIVVYSLAGKTRETLLKQIHAIPNLTMVICGCRERGLLKGMLLGSVSTYLVHNSPVPVSVVRPQNKEKSKKAKKTAAQKLSQSVRNGHLKVDEKESSSLSHNSYDGAF